MWPTDDGDFGGAHMASGGCAIQFHPPLSQEACKISEAGGGHDRVAALAPNPLSLNEQLGETVRDQPQFETVLRTSARWRGFKSIAPSGSKPDVTAGHRACTMQPAMPCTTQCRRLAAGVPRNARVSPDWLRPSGSSPDYCYAGVQERRRGARSKEVSPIPFVHSRVLTPSRWSR